MQSMAFSIMFLFIFFIHTWIVIPFMKFTYIQVTQSNVRYGYTLNEFNSQVYFILKEHYESNWTPIIPPLMLPYEWYWITLYNLWSEQSRSMTGWKVGPKLDQDCFVEPVTAPAAAGTQLHASMVLSFVECSVIRESSPRGPCPFL